MVVAVRARSLATFPSFPSFQPFAAFAAFAVVVAVVVVVMSSCTRAAAAPATAATPAPSSAPSTLATSAAPGVHLLPSDFVRGVNHAHIHRRGHGYGSDISAQTMDELAGYGVNWIAVTPFAFQPTATSSSLVGYGPGAILHSVVKDRTMIDDDIKLEVAHAHARHIQVALKPHLWAGDFGSGEWAGTVRQDDASAHATWWASYRDFMLQEAALAESAGIDLLVLGTELRGMTIGHGEEWRGLVVDVRKVYRGKLTYAAHWDQEAFAIDFWDALDVIGVSAYFPLDAPDDADVDLLVKAWAPHKAKLAALAARYPGKPLVFLEVGFRGVRGAHRTPWVMSGGTVDESEQARCYQATFAALHDAPWFRGVMFWKTFTDQHMADEDDDGSSYSFVGKPAGDVVRAWFR